MNAEKDRFHCRVAETIRAARKAQGLTIWDLAKKAGFGHTTIECAEKGSTIPLYVLAKIAEALDTTLDELVPIDALMAPVEVAQ